MCSHINEGGMGIKDICVWNKAMVTKLLWQVESKTDLLWIMLTISHEYKVLMITNTNVIIA